MLIISPTVSTPMIQSVIRTHYIRRIVFGPVESNMQPVTHEPTSIDFIHCEKVRVTMTTNVYLHLGMPSSELSEYSAFISRRKWSKVRIPKSIANKLDFHILFHSSHRAIDSQKIRTQWAHHRHIGGVVVASRRYWPNRAHSTLVSRSENFTFAK